MTLTTPPAVHPTHLVSTHGPFCEKCSARRVALSEPCRIDDDPQDRAERTRRSIAARRAARLAAEVSRG